MVNRTLVLVLFLVCAIFTLEASAATKLDHRRRAVQSYKKPYKKPYKSPPKAIPPSSNYRKAELKKVSVHRAESLKKYSVQPFRTTPKKYVYNIDSQNVTRYAYRKPLPTQVTMRRNVNADINNHGIGMKLRRAHAGDRKPASMVSSVPVIQKERPSQELKPNEIVQLKEN